MQNSGCHGNLKENLLNLVKYNWLDLNIVCTNGPWVTLYQDYKLFLCDCVSFSQQKHILWLHF